MRLHSFKSDFVTLHVANQGFRVYIAMTQSQRVASNFDLNLFLLISENLDEFFRLILVKKIGRNDKFSEVWTSTGNHQCDDSDAVPVF
jgi:hypothetical protein